ncbi:MAG: hypothetical protein ABJF88_10685 [Rhodothermales bacterium]
MWTQYVISFGLLLGAWSGSAAAQDTNRGNVYRFILGVDVPAEPAFVALDLAPTRVLRGSAPKPLSATVTGTFADDTMPAGVAVSVAPYFLAGGGIRTMESYRSRSVGGRLLRVFTKTVVSFGAAQARGDPSATLVGLAVRSTFHDPHDPALNSSLPEDVAALVGHDVPAAEEDVGGYGSDLTVAYARARRAMRARSGGGDPQVSGGWGMAGRLGGGVWGRDSLGTLRHTFWLGAQVTLNRRFDVLGTVHLRDAFGSEYALVGAALLRKTTALDLIAEVVYDTASQSLHPSLALGARVLPNVGVTAALTTQVPFDDPRDGPRTLGFRASVQWFYASDR